jgi:hypothetical protein
MLISAKRQWDIYTASKQAQCTNLVADDTWKWWEIIAMFCGLLGGIIGIVCFLAFLPLVIWVLSVIV